MLLTLLTFGGWKGWQWWEAHKPRPRVTNPGIEVTGKVKAPALSTVNSGVRSFSPVVLEFSQNIAPLAEVGKNDPAGVSLSPAVEGTWKWTNAKTLVFAPKNDWPAGSGYEVRLRGLSLPPEVRLKETEWTFTTPPFTLRFSEPKFETSLDDPTVHQILTEVTTSHPVSPATLEEKVRVEVVGGSPLFTWAGQTPARLFTVKEGKNEQQFWVRTARIQIPAREDFVKIIAPAGVSCLNGGKPLAGDVTAKGRVPDAATGLKIADIRPEIIRTDEGVPEQFLFVNTEGYVTGSALASHLEAWLLPKDKPASGTEEAVEDFAWEGQEGDVTPAVLKLARKVELKYVESEEDITEMHAFKLQVQEGGWLYLRTRSGMPGIGGFFLAQDDRRVVSVPEYPKELEILGDGALLALNGERKISIKSRGVSHVRYTIARVPAGQVNHLVTMTEGDFQAPQFRESWFFNEENIARIKREVRPLPLKNNHEAVYSSFDISPELIAGADVSDPDGSRGMFFITAEGVRPRTEEDVGGEDEDEDASEEDRKWISLGEDVVTRRFVLVTDLGLLVKQSADGSRDVFVQSIQSGLPVNGARLVVLAKNGEHVAEAVTADGHARIADVAHLKREKAPVAILARTGNDVAFIPFERVDRALDFSHFDTAGVLASEKEALDAYLYTERGIYRPGDAIHVGIIVRRRDWQGTLTGLPVEVEVLDTREHRVASEKLALPQDGCLDWECATSEASPTGIYQVNLYVLNGEERGERIGRSIIRVEEFQPDRMKLTTTLDQPAELGWVQPEGVSLDAKLETLFGFPAEGRRVTAKMDLSAAEFAFPSHPGFIFHNRLRKESQSLAGRTLELGEIKTDAAGAARFDLKLERFQDACFRLNVLVEAFEADGGRSVRGGLTALVSPFPYVVGYKGDGDLDYIGKDVVRKVRLVAVDSGLKALAVDSLTRRIIRIRHVSVLTKREDDSYGYVSTRKEDLVDDVPLALAADGTDLTLPTGNPGEYRLEVRDAENRVVCACPFSVVGKGESERSLERNAELELKLARPTWNSGEELELSISAPYTGGGLITIEREGVLAWKWFNNASTSSVQTIRVPEGLEGTAYVNVSFVRGLDSAEVFISPLSYAVEPFTANPDKRRLAVELEAPALVKPGEELAIGFKTVEASRVIIYAVDEGIHQITRYGLPQPLDHFFRKRALEVGTEQLLDLIMPEYSLLTKQSAFGGDEDEPPSLHLNPFKRRKEPPVVFWSGLVEGGPDRREVKYKVPDYFAGRLKIMAVAVSAGRMGQAETQSVVRGPFVLTPNVPTFASPGDEFTVSLTVANNLEGDKATDTVNVAVTPTSNLELVEAAPSPLKVAPGKETTTRFRLRAKNDLGNAELVFRAEAGGVAMTRTATLSVRPASPYITQVRSGYFRLASQELPVERALYPQFAKREATASVLPLGLARGLEAYLREYPHGCSEQITSRAVSRLVLADEADFGFTRAQAVEDLDRAFSLLASRQGGDGGFGYWDARAGAGLDFLSTYVTLFLMEASDAGFAVPEDLLSRSMARMKTMAAAKPASLHEAWVQSLAIYAMTRNGQVTTNYLLNLRDTLEAAHAKTWRLDPVAVVLASTYSLLQKGDEGARLLADWRDARRKAAAPQSVAVYHQSGQVKDALSFALMCRHFPKVAGGWGYDDLAVITEPIRRGQINTISSAVTILALKNYSTLAAESGIKVSMSELVPDVAEPRLLAPEKEGLLVAGFSPDAARVKFMLNRPSGSPDLGAFYQVMEGGFDLKPPQDVLRKGLEVHREILFKDGRAATEVTTGEGVTVKLSVRNISGRGMDDVALLDLLPGGFEVEPGNLSPGVNAVPGADYVDVREDRNVFYFRIAPGDVKTFTYRIKPVCAGAFIVPPAYVECMYDPELQGRSLAGRILVKPAP